MNSWVTIWLMSKVFSFVNSYSTAQSPNIQINLMQECSSISSSPMATMVQTPQTSFPYSRSLFTFCSNLLMAAMMMMLNQVDKNEFCCLSLIGWRDTPEERVVESTVVQVASREWNSARWCSCSVGSAAENLFCFSMLPSGPSGCEEIQTASRNTNLERSYFFFFSLRLCSALWLVVTVAAASPSCSALLYPCIYCGKKYEAIMT